MLISQIVTILLVLLIIYRGYLLFVSAEKLRKIIEDHYSPKGFEIENIKQLNFTERARYGEPPMGLFRINNFFNAIQTGTISYTRKVEVIDKAKNEATKYVEIIIRNKKLAGLNEFDSYDI